MLPHDRLTYALLEADGRPPHQGESTEVDEAAVCENVGFFGQLEVGGKVCNRQTTSSS